MGKHATSGMTWDQKRDRRRVMASEIASGVLIEDVAGRHQVTIATVELACRQYRVYPLIKRRPQERGRSVPGSQCGRVINSEKWDSVDWSLRNVDIAMLAGVSRERVRQVRILLNKPKSPRKNANNVSIRVETFLRSHGDAVSQLTMSQVLRTLPFKASCVAVKSACERMGVKLQSRPRMADFLTKENLCNFVQVTDRGCWIWAGNASRMEYTKIAGTPGHRFVFELFNGPIRDGLWCLHHCDNPACINPEHLYQGTAKDNARDRFDRGRTRLLTIDTAAEIRRRCKSGEKINDLATEFGVPYMTVYQLVTGRTYRGADAMAS